MNPRNLPFGSGFALLCQFLVKLKKVGLFPTPPVAPSGQAAAVLDLMEV